MRRATLSKHFTIDEMLSRLEARLARAASEAKEATLEKIAYLRERRAELERKQITPKHRELMYYIAAYGLIETGPLIKLAKQEWTRAERRANTLWQLGFAKRLEIGENSDLAYYASRKGISLLEGFEELDIEALKRAADNKREADYAQAKHNGQFSKLHGIEHRMKISRFHARLDLGCRAMEGVSLTDYQQESPQFIIKRPKARIIHDKREDTFSIEVFERKDECAKLIPDISGQFVFADPRLKPIHLYVEIDNGSMSIPEIMGKCYNYHHLFSKNYYKKLADRKVNDPIMRVAFETTDPKRCSRMVAAAASMKLSPGLFLFTYCGVFDRKEKVAVAGAKSRYLAKYLRDPAAIFEPVWFCPRDFSEETPQAHSILEPYYNQLAVKEQSLTENIIDDILEIDEMN